MPEYPKIDVAVVLLKRGNHVLAEANPNWNLTFSLPMARLRRRTRGGVPNRETPLDAAVRAAAQALGRPLPSSGLPQPVPLAAGATTLIRSGRDGQIKEYTYHVFVLPVSDAGPRHALGWVTHWMHPGDFLTHRPVSATAVHIIRSLPDALLAN